MGEFFFLRTEKGENIEICFTNFRLGNKIIQMAFKSNCYFSVLYKMRKFLKDKKFRPLLTGVPKSNSFPELCFRRNYRHPIPVKIRKIQ